MKKYKVTIQLIIGYYDSEYQSPKLRDAEYIVDAENKFQAEKKAKEMDNTSFSVWEIITEEL